MAAPLPGWFKKAVIYQIYPQSFYDSNNDGIGDLPGIISKLDYIASLGVNTLWLNPIFDSPFQDAGYDVRDYYKVAERYGTMEDLKNLFASKSPMEAVITSVNIKVSQKYSSPKRENMYPSGTKSTTVLINVSRELVPLFPTA